MAFENAANAVIFDEDRIRCFAVSNPEVPIHGERVAIHVQKHDKFETMIVTKVLLTFKDGPLRPPRICHAEIERTLKLGPHDLFL